MWNQCKVEQAEHAKQVGAGVGVWSQWRHYPKSLGQLREHIATNHLLQEPIETFDESECDIDFKGFETLHNIVLDMDDQVLWSDI